MFASNKKYQVYISYARNDVDQAKKLYTILSKRFISCFFDREALVAGADYAAIIQKAISNAKVVIVVCSENAERSAWLKKEVEYAVSRGKEIVPIMNNVDISAFSSLRKQLSEYGLYKYYPTEEFERKLDAGEFALLPQPRVLYSPSEPALGSAPMCGNFWGDDGIPQPLDTVVVAGGRGNFWGDDGIPQLKKTSRSLKKFFLIGVAALVLILIGVYGMFYQSSDSSYQNSPSPTNPVATMDSSANNLSFKGKAVEPDEDEATTQELIVSPEDILYYENELENKQTLIVILSLSLLLVLSISIWLTLRFRKRARVKSFISLTTDVSGDGKLNEDDSFVIEKHKSSTLQIDKGTQKLKLNFADKNKPKKLNCFIAGSTALQSERDAIRSTISVVYNRWKDKNFQVLSYTFEDFTSKFVKNGQQSLYNQLIENEADIAVFIIKGFVGDKTLEEFDIAYNAYCQYGRPSIVVYYFPEGDETDSVKALKAKVESKSQYWITISSVREMKLHFTDIINTDVWNLYTDEL